MSEWKQILIENLLFAADIGLICWFLRLYKNKYTTADQIKDLESIDWSAFKSDSSGCIEYGLVEGRVHSLEQPLKSQFTEDEGPIKYFKRVLLKSERNRGYWTDRQNVLSESYEKVKFALQDEKTAERILVTEPRLANYLQEALHTTHDHFEPCTRSLSESLFDRVVGEITKGYQTTEQILKNGTTMLGVGKIVYSNGSLELRKPTAKGTQYFLTSMSKSELITHLKSRATIFKVLAGVFGVTGLLILWVTTGSRIRKWIAQYRERAAVEEARQQLLVIRGVNTVHSRNRNADSDTDLTENSDSPQRSPSSEANSCVICLINSRDIANRPCGHVCTCLNCYEAMPVPKHCPVCRSAINEIIPIYIP